MKGHARAFRFDPLSAVEYLADLQKVDCVLI